MAASTSNLLKPGLDCGKPVMVFPSIASIIRLEDVEAGSFHPLLRTSIVILLSLSRICPRRRSGHHS